MDSHIDPLDAADILRSRGRWKTAAIGLACVLVGVLLGGMQPARPPLQAVAIRPDDSSGLWKDTLYGVDSTGTIYRFDTKVRPGRWEKFSYSP
jgi:hypothetical protein